MTIDPIVYSARPAEKRSPSEDRCYDFLEEQGISFERVDHEHADTIEACLDVEKVLGCKICKNLLLTNRQMTDLYLLLMPGDKPFRTKFLSRQLGCARLSFATPEQMLAHLGVTPGSVSLLGLIQDKDHAVRLLIDNDLLSDEYLGCHPCMNTSSLKLRMEDVLKKIIPATGHGLPMSISPGTPRRHDKCPVGH